MRQLIHVPGLNYEIKSLKHNVVSCLEASTAKGLPLQNELKSLILSTSSYICVVHLPGNKNVNLRSIKRKLNVNEVYLASRDILASLDVPPGTVCPFVDSIWKLPQLVSEDLIDLQFVSTNAGELNRYIVFNPQVILQNPNVVTGIFSK